MSLSIFEPLGLSALSNILQSPTIQGTINAGTGLTMPAITLGGLVTTGGQTFDAGAGDFKIATTGNKGIEIVSTNTGATGSLIYGYLNSSSPAAGDVLLGINAGGKDSAGNYEQFVSLGFICNDPTNASEDGECDLTLMANGTGTGKVFKWLPTGFFVTPNGVTVGASQGASFGPAGVTSITVVGGIITAIS